MDEQVISFGPFRLLAPQRLLLEGDQPVRLGSRALDILAVLAENAGRVVSKEELIARVWPNVFVEESNLKIQVSALRRALGDGQGGNRYIVTVPGRGYEFVVPVGLTAEPAAMPAPTVPLLRMHNLPLALTRMIGRDDALAALVARLSRERLVTLVGPGGIGKTTLALAVAESMVAAYEHGVWLVDLAPLGDPRLVPSAVATVLGLGIHAEDPLRGLVAGLRDKRTLLLLDNCEHIIDAAASLAAAVVSGTPGVNILATSRELLGVTGERGYRLGPLGSPQPLSGQSASEAAAFPAVQLFVERVTEIVEDFALTDANAPLIAEICQRLDGLPLAIEFAAPRVEVLGVDGLATHLDGGLPLLRARRRTTAARHQTMRAVVDWSYGLLGEDEQLFLRALGIFAGGFTVEAAAAVASDPTTGVDAIDLLADLVAKSLVVADVSGARPRFRLLDTTRAYALEKLVESGEGEQVARRHAQYYRDLFEPSRAKAEVRSIEERLASYRLYIDNVRAALQWAFSPEGDASVGVAIAAATVPMWVNLSLVAECRRHVERALARLPSVAEGDARTEMQLQAALGVSLNYTTGPVSATAAAWRQTLTIAERLGDLEYQLRGLRGLWAHHMNAGDYRQALALAHEFRDRATASADPTDLDFGDRMAAIILHYLGDQESAARHLERGLARAHADQAPPTRFLLDRDVTLRALSARILWLQGSPDQATRTARAAMDRAVGIGHALSLCHALAQAVCPVALYIGDLVVAEESVATLLDIAREQGLSGWVARGRCFLGMVAIGRRDAATGVPLLREALAELRESGSAPGSPAFLAMLAEGLGRAGQVSNGLATIDEAMALSDRHEERWCLPELFRIKGELLLLTGSSETTASAQDWFRQALDSARRDGTLAWELRAATSLGRWLNGRRCSAAARDLLASVYGRFTEGFATADLRAAEALLAQLG